VAPHALRNALAAMPGAEAKLNQMADAAEVLDKLYEAFAIVSDAQRSGVAPEDTPVARMFGIRVSEAVRCRCGVTSHTVDAFNLYFHMAKASALRALAAEDGGAPFEARLRQLLQQDTKGCDRDLGSCGELQPVTYSLERLPQVFTLSLTWASTSEPEEDVAATMAALSPTVRLSRIYGDVHAAGLPAEDAVFELRSLVCYNGSHYECFCRPQDGAGPWTRFDDANVNIVGDGGWEALKRNAAKGHLQGTVLFYERQELMF
jgi:alkylhydroperoxidase family enzyme